MYDGGIPERVIHKQLWGEAHHIVKYSCRKDIMAWALENCFKQLKVKSLFARNCIPFCFI